MLKFTLHNSAWEKCIWCSATLYVNGAELSDLIIRNSFPNLRYKILPGWMKWNEGRDKRTRLDIRSTEGRVKSAYNLFPDMHVTCSGHAILFLRSPADRTAVARHPLSAYHVTKSYSTSYLESLPCLPFLPAAFFAAYRFASSCAFPIFFLYRIRLFPNQFDTWNTDRQCGS
jgi:hypothetical protein